MHDQSTRRPYQVAELDMQMWLHPAKCRTMHLGKHNPNIKYILPTDDGTLQEIAQTPEEIDLRVTMDDKPTFSRHIQLQVNKANSAVGLIRHTLKYLDKESFLYLYTILIHPHLEYAPVISYMVPKNKETSRQQRESVTRLLPETFHLSYNDR